MKEMCPFNEKIECGSNCPLFIAPDDLNEFVTARLSSIGVMNRQNGLCSIRMIALSAGREIFENTRARG